MLNTVRSSIHKSECSCEHKELNKEIARELNGIRGQSQGSNHIASNIEMSELTKEYTVVSRVPFNKIGQINGKLLIIYEIEDNMMCNISRTDASGTQSSDASF